MSHKLRTLIVDDNTDLTESLKDILELKGLVAVGAEGGEEAVKLARQQRFDLVLLDLVMPGMNGIEALRAIKKLSPETKFIIVTAYTTSSQAEEAKKEGALKVFGKPVPLKEIVELITTLKPAGGE